MSAIRFLSRALLAVLLSLPVHADVDVRDSDADMYPADVSYDASIPTPESVLGHELGRQPVRHHALVDYLRDGTEPEPLLLLEPIAITTDNIDVAERLGELE